MINTCEQMNRYETYTFLIIGVPFSEKLIRAFDFRALPILTPDILKAGYTPDKIPTFKMSDKVSNKKCLVNKLTIMPSGKN